MPVLKGFGAVEEIAEFDRPAFARAWAASKTYYKAVLNTLQMPPDEETRGLISAVNAVDMAITGYVAGVIGDDRMGELLDAVVEANVTLTAKYDSGRTADAAFDYSQQIPGLAVGTVVGGGRKSSDNTGMFFGLLAIGLFGLVLWKGKK